MKYKIGDKVKVRTDLMPGNVYGGGTTYFVFGMEKFLGKTLTIKGNFPYSYSESYCVEENCWWWTDEMFEQPNAVSAKFSKEVMFK